MAEGNDCILGHVLHQNLAPVRIPLIVLSCPHVEGAARFVDEKIEVPVHPEIRRLPDISDPGVPSHIRLADFVRAVCGGIIRDDELVIRKRLRQQTVKRTGNELLPVIYSQTNAESRVRAYSAGRHPAVSFLHTYLDMRLRVARTN